VELYLAFGKYGNVRFGGPDARPEFSRLSWVAMFFCAGVGTALLAWSSKEWSYYYVAPPFDIEPMTKEASRWAATYGIFHWGPLGWVLYSRLLQPEEIGDAAVHPLLRPPGRRPDERAPR
jgi:BCCT family betaine/carnitine transporter